MTIASTSSKLRAFNQLVPTYSPTKRQALQPMSKRFPSTILATAVIPWDEEYRFQENLFRRQVRLLRDGLTPYIYLFGTAGEGYAVSDQQFDAIVDAFRDEMLPGAHPMVGVINLSLQTIIERIER